MLCAATTHGSFAALGVHAVEITSAHQSNDALGERSSLGAIYRLEGKVLLLGYGHDSNTSLHLAEWRRKSPPRGVTGSSIRQNNGTTTWTTWTDVVEREDDFEPLGAAFEATVGLSVGQVGNATARLVSQRALVDFRDCLDGRPPARTVTAGFIRAVETGCA